jgi:hypothetical protein
VASREGSVESRPRADAYRPTNSVVGANLFSRLNQEGPPDAARPPQISDVGSPAVDLLLRSNVAAVNHASTLVGFAVGVPG